MSVLIFAPECLNLRIAMQCIVALSGKDEVLTISTMWSLLKPTKTLPRVTTWPFEKITMLVF